MLPPIVADSMATRHTTTASNSTNLWVKPPYVITCDEAVVAVHVFEQSELKLLCKFALKAYLQSGKLRESGRGANALHGVDLRGDLLLGGTHSGLLLCVPLSPPPSGDAPPLHELAGHTKVVHAAVLSPRDAKIAFTGSFDRTVRQWGELPAGVPLQTVKVGTPVIALEIIPDAASAEAQLLLGGGDGTVRLWTPACRKASKALATLKYIHDEYAGILRLSPDGGRLLSCSRSGQLQLWRRGKGGVYEPTPADMPAADLSNAWRLEPTAQGLIEVGGRGECKLWRWGARAATIVAEPSVPALLLETPSAVAVAAAASDTETDVSYSVAFAGLRHADGGSTGGGVHLEAVQLLATWPVDAPPPAPATGLNSARWGEIAEEEGVVLDDALQSLLGKMEGVAIAAGRELTDASVRQMIRRQKTKAP